MGAYSIFRHTSINGPSTFLNDISSEAMRPILFISTYSIYIYRWGKKYEVFCSDRVKTQVFMATHSSH